jgi:UDP:flavonoid glycosyltransferase YjiC (YdhE family)
MSQQRNAERIDALGIGIHLTQTDDQESLQAAIHAALAVPSYATQARLARKSLLNLSSPGTVLSQLADELT